MTPRSLAEPARRASLHVLRHEADERLVGLVRAGSQPAFEAVVERYRAPLVRYAAGIVGHDSADEVVQESLVCAHTALLRGDDLACLRAWLYRIVRNRSLNLVRDRGPAGVPLDDGHAALDTPEMAAERRQALRRVVDAVQGLPLNQRDAIVLRELEGRSYDEIAGRLGVSDPAVRGLLNRARVTLRRAAAAVAPVWPTRLAELWSMGTVGGSGAARASATCLVAAVATAGGIAERPAKDPDPPRAAPSASASATTSTTSAAEVRGEGRPIADRSSPPRVEPAPVLAPISDRGPAAAVETEQPERERVRAEPEPKTTAEPDEWREPRERNERHASYSEPRQPPEGSETYSSPPPERRIRTAEAEPVDDGFRKSPVGSVDGDGGDREFSH